MYSGTETILAILISDYESLGLLYDVPIEKRDIICASEEGVSHCHYCLININSDICLISSCSVI